MSWKDRFSFGNRKFYPKLAMDGTKLEVETEPLLDTATDTVNENIQNNKPPTAEIKELWVDEDFGRNNPHFGDPKLKAVMGKVKTNSLDFQAMLDNGSEIPMFSIRSAGNGVSPIPSPKIELITPAVLEELVDSVRQGGKPETTRAVLTWAAKELNEKTKHALNHEEARRCVDDLAQTYAVSPAWKEMVMNRLDALRPGVYEDTTEYAGHSTVEYVVPAQNALPRLRDVFKVALVEYIKGKTKVPYKKKPRQHAAVRRNIEENARRAMAFYSVTDLTEVYSHKEEWCVRVHFEEHYKDITAKRGKDNYIPLKNLVEDMIREAVALTLNPHLTSSPTSPIQPKVTTVDINDLPAELQEQIKAELAKTNVGKAH